MIRSLRDTSQQLNSQALADTRDASRLNYRFTTDEEGNVQDMITLKKRAIPKTFQRAHAFTNETTRGSLNTVVRQLDDTDAGTAEMYGSDGIEDIDGLAISMAGSSSASSAWPRLRAFTYCTSQTELFEPLWNMNLIDQVQWVGSIEEADLVIHRRPVPGEKQFHYHVFRKKAKELGMPFVSINAATPEELRGSLLPVFRLYAGQITAGQLQGKSQPGRGGRRRRKNLRIRL